MSEALGAAAQENEATSTPGALLRRERERRALSVQQTAEDLHLDPWVIEAIESDRFQVLGAPVYAKGHLRKYAARLGLSVEDVIARYEALQDRPVETDPIPAAVAAPIPQLRRSSKLPVRTAAALVAIGGMAWVVVETFPAVSDFLQARSARSTIEVPVTAIREPVAAVEPPPSGQVLPAASEQPIPNPSAVPAEEGALSSTTPASAAVSEPVPAAGESISLRLEFSGESWTEVVDAEGRRLMFAMGTPGRARTLTGVPPLQVTLGVASAVSAQVNGRQVVIPEREGSDSSRFTIGPDGDLR